MIESALMAFGFAQLGQWIVIGTLVWRVSVLERGRK